MARKIKEVYEFTHLGFGELTKEEVKKYKEIVDMIAKTPNTALVFNPTSFDLMALSREEIGVLIYAKQNIPAERFIGPEEASKKGMQMHELAEKKIKSKLAKKPMIIPMGAVLGHSGNPACVDTKANKLSKALGTKDVRPYIRLSRTGVRTDVSKTPKGEKYLPEEDLAKMRKLFKEYGWIKEKPKPLPPIQERIKKIKKKKG